MGNERTFWVVRSPILTVVTTLVITLAIGWFVQYFRIDASAETLLVKDNQLYIKSQVMAERFSPDEFILLAYKPKNHQVFSEKTFKHLQSLTEQLKQLPRVRSVTHILNVPLLSQMKSLDPNIEPDDWTWETKKYSHEQMRGIFDKHPLFTDLLVNKEVTATSIQIVFKKDKELAKIDSEIIALQKKMLTNDFTEVDDKKIEQLKKQADPILQALNKQRKQEIEQIYEIAGKLKSDADIFLGGSYLVGHQLINIIQNDLKLFGGAIGLAICIMLFVLFRQWRWVIIPVTCCVTSVVLTMGLFGLLDLRTTIISSNFIALQMILTLAISVHLIVQYRQLENEDSDASQEKLVSDMLRKKIKPCFYAGITTSVGFGSLIFSGIQPVVSFGWMMIVAMLVSIAISLIFLPAMLSLFKRNQRSPDNNFSKKVIDAIAKATLARPGIVFTVSTIIVVVSVLGLLRLTVENSFLNYFAKDTKVYQELTFIDQEFGGSTPLDVVLTIPKSDQNKELALSAKSVQQAQVAQTILQQYTASGNTTSVVNFTELAKQLNDGRPLTEYELTAIYRLVDDNLRESLIGSYFSKEHNQLRISSRVQDSTEGLNRAEYLENIRKDFQANGIEESEYELTNLFVLYQDILQRLFNSQILTLGIVYLALFVVMWILFKQFSVALVALVPNIICTLLILSIMGYANIPLDLMTITIAAIAMGIAVDDTIHFVHHYLAGGKDRESAVKGAYFSVGYAMLFTTLIICVGFALLAFSDFIPSVLFGILTALAMLIALITDLTLLPAMLTRFVKLPENAK